MGSSPTGARAPPSEDRLRKERDLALPAKGGAFSAKDSSAPGASGVAKAPERQRLLLLPKGGGLSATATSPPAKHKGPFAPKEAKDTKGGMPGGALTPKAASKEKEKEQKEKDKDQKEKEQVKLAPVKSKEQILLEMDKLDKEISKLQVRGACP
eukprot:4546306-Pyramimonas_sp.AAC.1